MQKSRPGMLPVSIKDKAGLYAAYMPFIKNGGLFVRTKKTYTLGDEVFILLNLMGSNERLPVAGKVIWITPQGSHGNRACGIGVQFLPADKGATRGKVETQLAGLIKSDRITLTM